MTDEDFEALQETTTAIWLAAHPEAFEQGLEWATDACTRWTRGLIADFIAYASGDEAALQRLQAAVAGSGWDIVVEGPRRLAFRKVN